MIENPKQRISRLATLAAMLFVAAASTVAAHAQTLTDGGLPSAIERDLAQKFRDAGATVEAWQNGNIRALILNNQFVDADMPVVAGLRNLHWLNLHHANVSDRGMSKLAAMKQLRGLYLPHEITDDGLGLLDGMPDLERLSFQHCERVTDKGFAHVRRLTKLQDLVTPDLITDDSLRVLAKLKKMTSLHLTGPGITDDGLRHLAGATELKTLVLPPAVTGTGLSHLRGLTGLSNILVSRATTDEGVRQLAGFTELTRIDLASCDQVTDAAFKHLRELPKLQVVSLGPGATDKAVDELAEYPALTQISLTLAQVTDACIPSLTRVSKLDSLQVPSTISAKGLAQLVPLKQLESLSLMGAFSDDVVPVLLEMDGVEILTLHNTDVSEASIKKLQEHRHPKGLHLFVSRR
ncbi:MAG: hypothetical protein O3C40_13715 [Planctomycetota bacterium]|nr:hypothetical protein [Planctomycetota bacterium]